tara:strand:- start:39 stop:878 length:840 start_codon:yes stop_codon:yes gene_type:complete
MKKNFQTEIIRSLNDINKNLKIINKSETFTKKSFSDGLLEWDHEENQFFKIKHKNSNAFDNLLFLENQKNILINNTVQFLKGKPANSALLWGARGTGKSSLIISVYNALIKKFSFSMIEIKFFQIEFMPRILRLLEKKKNKIIIFCDDFSFESNDEKFILYKNILEGSLRRNPNIIFYITSNYRHLVRNNLNDNINGSHNKDTNENFISLSDRFGIWLGFHSFSKEEYIKIVFSYAKYFKLSLKPDLIKRKAIEWSILRGSYSGREAINFIKFLLLEKI